MTAATSPVYRHHGYFASRVAASPDVGRLGRATIAPHQSARAIRFDEKNVKKCHTRQRLVGIVTRARATAVTVRSGGGASSSWGGEGDGGTVVRFLSGVSGFRGACPVAPRPAASRARWARAAGHTPAASPPAGGGVGVAVGEEEISSSSTSSSSSVSSSPLQLGDDARGGGAPTDGDGAAAEATVERDSDASSSSSSAVDEDTTRGNSGVESSGSRARVDDRDDGFLGGGAGARKTQTQHKARKKATVRNLFRRLRGLQALTEEELAEVLAVNRALREARRLEKVAKTAETARRRLAAKQTDRAANDGTPRRGRAGFQVFSRKSSLGEKFKSAVASSPVARMNARTKTNDATTIPRQNQSRTRQPPRRRNPDEAYEVLRGEFDKEKLRQFFKRRPGQIAARLAAVLRVGTRLVRLWRREEKLPPERRTRADQVRTALSGLGPVFVKIGQTLAQRADLIGDEAADALKALQQSNAPFPDAVAYRTVAEDLEHAGPLAPGHPSRETCDDPDGEPLFAACSDGPVAAASLGQVYRARTWDGREVAVKVQRPRVLRQVALDWTVWSLCLSALKRVWGSKADLSAIADEVGEGVFKELDYVQEAKNMDEFNRRHAWLGFVRAPRWFPEYTGPEGRARVLTTEWIDGDEISNLPAEQRLVMAQMAVEACVAQLTYTGFVHADPHEGNLLLDRADGSLVFLDFGLVAEVEPYVMEGFARGIQCMIAGDWLGLTYVFREVGLTPPENYYRKETVKGEKKKRLVPCSAEDMAEAIRTALEAEEGGQSRFGALATGLGAMSNEYRFLTPPYIVLLVRTFLTLEGIAAKADPDFNIYTASLPYAIRRAMAPATEGGQKAMRDAFLNADDSVRWERIEELLGGAGAAASDDAAATAAAGAGAPSSGESKKPTTTTVDRFGPEGEASVASNAAENGASSTDAAAGATAAVAGEAYISIDEEELAVVAPMAKAGEQLLTEVMDTAAAAAASSSAQTPASASASASASSSASSASSFASNAGSAGDSKELIARRSQEVMGRLIGAREGAALRRVSYEACSVSLASYLASSKAASLRQVGVETMSAVLQDLWTVRKAELAKKGRGGGGGGARDWPESTGARVIREREEKTQRKAVTVIVLGHLKKLWSDGPRGMLLLAHLAATALRMALLAVVYAAVGAARDWLQLGCGYAWGLVTAPAKLVTKLAAFASASSASAEAEAGAGVGTGTGTDAAEKHSDSATDED